MGKAVAESDYHLPDMTPYLVIYLYIYKHARHMIAYYGWEAAIKAFSVTQNNLQSYYVLSIVPGCSFSSAIMCLLSGKCV